MRRYLLTPKLPKAKMANSQSPIQKKRLLEFAPQSLKTDKSIHDLSIKMNPNPQSSNSTKVIDFRQEVERRFQRSGPNKNYVFPRKSDISLSSDSSLTSLRDAGEYDLHSQDFKASILLERRTSFDRKELKEKDYRKPESKRVSSNKERLTNSSRITNEKPKADEESFGKSNEFSFYRKIISALKESNVESPLIKALKLTSSKSQTAMLNMKEQLDFKSEQQPIQKSEEAPNQQPMNINANAKTINLNVSINMNIGIREPQITNSKQKTKMNQSDNMSCIINESINPKTPATTKGSKDQKLDFTQSLNYFTNRQLKPVNKLAQEYPLGKSILNGINSTSIIDRSINNLKNSYSLLQNDGEKSTRQRKVPTLKLKLNQENLGCQNSLLSLQLLERPRTSRGTSKTKKKKDMLKLYKKSKIEPLQRIYDHENKPSRSPPKNIFLKMSTTPLSARFMESQTKKKEPSLKLNNFLYHSTNSLRNIGQSPVLKGDINRLKFVKDFHNIDKKASTMGFKDFKTNSKREGSKTARRTSNKEADEASTKKKIGVGKQTQKIDKSKIKLNLQGLGQKFRPFTDRAGQFSDRSEGTNRSHAEYFG